jgi:hypothetical protein
MSDRRGYIRDEAESNKESIMVTIVIFSTIALVCEIYAAGLAIGVLRHAANNYGEAPGVSLFTYLVGVAVVGIAFVLLAFQKYRQYRLGKLAL